jgi:hypothetical protein
MSLSVPGTAFLNRISLYQRSSYRSCILVLPVLPIDYPYGVIRLQLNDPQNHDPEELVKRKSIKAQCRRHGVIRMQVHTKSQLNNFS